jgi:hypothetical protein
MVRQNRVDEDAPGWRLAGVVLFHTVVRPVRWIWRALAPPVLNAVRGAWRAVREPARAAVRSVYRAMGRAMWSR